ncbi:MAG: hypothetical protein J3K34DRAFT_509307 [Monoraphidium minutum]|nr:MAG: hypothetical protein J3K34DRAFT_509307 [Monoraphidium minutum]
MSTLWRISVQRLGHDLSEASELATVLQEVAPGLTVDGVPAAPPSRPSSSSGCGTPVSARERVRAARPIDVDPSCVPWHALRGVVSSESLHEPAELGEDQERPQLVEVNTGGSVFFLLFGLEDAGGDGGHAEPRRSRLGGDDAPAGSAGGAAGRSGGGRAATGGGGGGACSPRPRGGRAEGVAVLKVAGSRLAMQSEQFANELARHLGIAAPLCRLVRQAGDGAGEWAAAHDAANALGVGGDELAGELGRMPCFLLMEYVAGRPLLEGAEPLQGAEPLALLEDVGRLLALDMLLGNADRLPCPELGWRGNGANVLLGAQGSKYSGRTVAIDSCVARRPPALKSCAEDAAVERLAQLVLTAPDVAAGLLAQLLGPSALAGPEPEGRVAAFTAGFRETLARGLLEMMQASTAEWVAGFLEDVAALLPGGLRPAGGGPAPPPLGELAAGMRTPPHLSPRPGSVGSMSARAMSPRSSLPNREGGAPTAGGGASPGPLRANSLVRGSRSFTLGHRAPSGALGGGCTLSPGSNAATGEPASSGRGAPQAAGDGLSSGTVSAIRLAAARLVPRVLFSAPGDQAQQEQQTPVPAGGQQPPAPAAGAPAPVPLPRPPPPVPLECGAGRRASFDDLAAWRSASVSMSPGRSPRDPLEVRASGGASLSAAVSSALASIEAKTKHDKALEERVAAWKERFRERGATLAAAIISWQARHHLERVLTTGFLDGSHPLVDGYELSVRLEHMLQRLGALAGAATAEAPVQVMPRLFLGGAVAADSHHLLVHMGVTHILNATEELLLPPASAGFEVMRVALRDADSEDIAFHFERVRRWLDAALADGGSVLVHCHEGRSRSVTLVAAFLMMTAGDDLAAALARIRCVRPCAAPNAGFLAALLGLEERLTGSRSAIEALRGGGALKRGKPAARVCPVCGEPAGVSSGSLAVHMRSRHGRATAAAPGQLVG